MVIGFGEAESVKVPIGNTLTEALVVLMRPLRFPAQAALAGVVVVPAVEAAAKVSTPLLEPLAIVMLLALTPEGNPDTFTAMAPLAGAEAFIFRFTFTVIEAEEPGLSPTELGEREIL